MEIKKIFLLLSVFCSFNLNSGIFAWLDNFIRKHDNTITAGAAGAIAAAGTFVGLDQFIPGKMLDGYKIENPERTRPRLVLCTSDITNIHSLLVPRYVYNQTGNNINRLLLGLKIALSSISGYFTYKKTKEYLDNSNFDKSELIVKELGLKEKDKGQEFYKSVGYLLKPILDTDTVIIALYKNKIIGIVRLSYENNICVLRGMQIAKEFRRKGIGTLLIKKLNNYIGSNTCWCIPHKWLESFYSQIGFKKIDENKAPLFLLERIIETRKKYPQVIMMLKSLQ